MPAASLWSTWLTVQIDTHTHTQFEKGQMATWLCHMVSFDVACEMVPFTFLSKNHVWFGRSSNRWLNCVSFLVKHRKHHAQATLFVLYIVTTSSSPPHPPSVLPSYPPSPSFLQLFQLDLPLPTILSIHPYYLSLFFQFFIVLFPFPSSSNLFLPLSSHQLRPGPRSQTCPRPWGWRRSIPGAAAWSRREQTLKAEWTPRNSEWNSEETPKD